jgi:ABC-type phosphate/phosphonate transport system substrate-binding protein
LALASNTAVNTIEDLKGKVIAGQAISVFAAGQSQFYVMLKAGLDYIMDPKQVVFTGNHDETVQGVLSGRWDVGFVPSGRAEYTVDEDTGKLIDSNLFKVIEPKIAIMNNGDLFPFLHSTPVFPEWPLFAKKEVDRVVAEEVAIAMMEFNAHKKVGTEIHRCMEEAETPEELELCNTMPPVYFDPAARCDTTRELAELAYQAGTAGHHSGMRPAKSHFQVRTMQQDAGFIIRDSPNGKYLMHVW